MSLLVLLAALLWMAAAGIAVYPAYSWDDAFITYQYARNFAHGAGLRFNAADAHPTEGFSSLLHAGVVAAGFLADLDPLLLTRVVSIACFLALPLVLGVPLARLAGCGRLDSCATVAALQLLWFVPRATGYHLHLGMETFLFQFGVALLLAWTLAELVPEASRPSPRARLALGLCAALLVVPGRPEGFVLALLSPLWVMLVRRFHYRDLDRRSTRALLGLAAAVAGGVVLLFLWKKSYFGHFLPNPYYVKSGKGVWGYAGPLLPGLAEVRGFLRFVALPALVGGLLLLVLPRPARVRSALALAVVPGLVVVALYARAIHEAAYPFRFLFPYAVHVLMPLAGAVCLALARRRPLQRAVPLAVGGTALAGLLLFSPTVRAAAAHPGAWLGQRLDRPSKPWWVGTATGVDLARTGLGERATVATSMAGALTWYSGMRVVDLMGLASDGLSGRDPLTPEEYWNRVEAERPDVFVSGYPPASPGFEAGSDDPVLGAASVAEGVRTGWGSEITRLADRGLLREMRQREMIHIRDHYFFGTATRVGGTYWVLTYIRRDSPLRFQLCDLTPPSHADQGTDLARYYGNDPRALKMP